MKHILIVISATAITLCCACSKPSGLTDGGKDTPISHGTRHSVTPVTISSLLDEMISYEEDCFIPSPWYTSCQSSSTDPRSISPDCPYWFANQDNMGYVRIGNDNADRRMEKVLFEQEGPGAVTRFWTTGIVKDYTLRFYFDGEKTARVSIKGNDFTKMPFHLPEPLVLKHTHYEEKGGTSLHYPLPYSKSLKITIDSGSDFGFAYHIGYRTYETGTDVRTFTITEANQLASQADKTAEALKNPPEWSDGEEVATLVRLKKDEAVVLNMPKGSKAIRHLTIKVGGFNSTQQKTLMRGLVVKMKFDGKQTVWAPLGDFSGGGIGGFMVDSWYMTADGRGKCEWRFVMPYRETAEIEVLNTSNVDTDVEIRAKVSDWIWYDNTAYFHASFRQERGLQTSSDYEGSSCREWLFCELSGKGTLVGDVLSLHNGRDTWYGEGDEKIYIDGESFPSHFGTGTEDYYNTSFAPVEVFHTPFGGAVRADNESSYGYNTWLRLRNIDDITFGTSLKFHFELLGWHPATVIYSSTAFWYGDHAAEALHTSSTEELTQTLP